MSRLFGWLSGKKRALAAIGGCVLAWAQAKGWVDPSTAIMLASVLSVLTGIAVADAARKGSLSD